MEKKLARTLEPDEIKTNIHKPEITKLENLEMYKKSDAN